MLGHVVAQGCLSLQVNVDRLISVGVLFIVEPKAEGTSYTTTLHVNVLRTRATPAHIVRIWAKLLIQGLCQTWLQISDVLKSSILTWFYQLYILGTSEQAVVLRDRVLAWLKDLLTVAFRVKIEFCEWFLSLGRFLLLFYDVDFGYNVELRREHCLLRLFLLLPLSGRLLLRLT